MNYSTDTSEIKSQIALDQAVVNIFKIKHNRTNIPLPLFLVDLTTNLSKTTNTFT